MRRVTLILFAALLAGCRGDRIEEPLTTTERQAETATPSSEVEPPSLSAPAKGLRVDFASFAGTATGYLSVPSTAGPHPGVIVVQEWWGVDGWVKEQTDRLAGLGYVALAVDLYRGRVARDPDLAHQLMRGLPEDQALADLRGGIDYLSARPDVDASRVGVIGWCMGGGYALKLATVEPRLKAAVVNYGSLITDPASIARIQAPLLGHFGGRDQGIPPAVVRAFESSAKRAGKTVDLKIYDTAGHAFMNPDNQAGYDANAATDAWNRTTEFLEQTLRPSS